MPSPPLAGVFQEHQAKKTHNIYTENHAQSQTSSPIATSVSAPLLVDSVGCALLLYSSTKEAYILIQASITSYVIHTGVIKVSVTIVFLSVK